MTIILDHYAIPETGSFEIRQTVNLAISSKQAQRKVDTWLLLEVSMMMGAETPTLLLGERSIWRVPVRFTAPHVGRVGTAGEVEIDAQSGEIYNPITAKTTLLRTAKTLAKKLPPFRVRPTPPEYLAKNFPIAPQLTIREDGEVVVSTPIAVR